jgi:acetyl esterase/lipase
VGGLVGMSGYLPFQGDIEDAVRDTEELGEDDPFAVEEGDEQQPEEPVIRAQLFERDLLCLRPLPSPTRENTSYSTPIFLGHGSVDEKKPYIVGEAAAVTMRAAGYEVDWKLYEGLGHWYKIPDEINDIVDFVRFKVGWKIDIPED